MRRCVGSCNDGIHLSVGRKLIAVKHSICVFCAYRDNERAGAAVQRRFVAQDSSASVMRGTGVFYLGRGKQCLVCSERVL
jgi:hypothetical protein